MPAAGDEHMHDPNKNRRLREGENSDTQPGRRGHKAAKAEDRLVRVGFTPIDTHTGMAASKDAYTATRLDGKPLTDHQWDDWMGLDTENGAYLMSFGAEAPFGFSTLAIPMGITTKGAEVGMSSTGILSQEAAFVGDNGTPAGWWVFGMAFPPSDTVEQIESDIVAAVSKQAGRSVSKAELNLFVPKNRRLISIDPTCRELAIAFFRTCFTCYKTCQTTPGSPTWTARPLGFPRSTMDTDSFDKQLQTVHVRLPEVLSFATKEVAELCLAIAAARGGPASRRHLQFHLGLSTTPTVQHVVVEDNLTRREDLSTGTLIIRCATPVAADELVKLGTLNANLSDVSFNGTDGAVHFVNAPGESVTFTFTRAPTGQLRPADTVEIRVRVPRQVLMADMGMGFRQSRITRLQDAVRDGIPMSYRVMHTCQTAVYSWAGIADYNEELLDLAKQPKVYSGTNTSRLPSGFNMVVEKRHAPIIEGMSPAYFECGELYRQALAVEPVRRQSKVADSAGGSSTAPLPAQANVRELAEQRQAHAQQQRERRERREQQRRIQEERKAPTSSNVAAPPQPPAPYPPMPYFGMPYFMPGYPPQAPATAPTQQTMQPPPALPMWPYPPQWPALPPAAPQEAKAQPREEGEIHSGSWQRPSRRGRHSRRE